MHVALSDEAEYGGSEFSVKERVKVILKCI
jgi:hypothetical protein